MGLVPTNDNGVTARCWRSRTAGQGSHDAPMRSQPFERSLPAHRADSKFQGFRDAREFVLGGRRFGRQDHRCPFGRRHFRYAATALAERAPVRRHGAPREDVLAATTTAVAEFEGACSSGPDAVEVRDKEKGLVEGDQRSRDDGQVVLERRDQRLRGREAFASEPAVLCSEHADLCLHVQRRAKDEVLRVRRPAARRAVPIVEHATKDEARRQAGDQGDRAPAGSEADALSRRLERLDPYVREGHGGPTVVTGIRPVKLSGQRCSWNEPSQKRPPRRPSVAA
jgi:hypothetical protein